MPRITIATSNLAMRPKSAIFGGVVEHEDFLEAAGYRPGAEVAQAAYAGGGFEWTDVRNPRNVMWRSVAQRLAARGLISSLHQSWRSTTVPEIATRFFDPHGTWHGIPNTPRNVVRSLGLAATIPPISSWVRTLLPIQEAAGGVKLPVVAYPNEQQSPHESSRFNFDYPRLSKGFAALRYQPTAELLAAWGVLKDDADRTVEGMLQKQHQYGFEEIVGDTRHAFEGRYGFHLRDPAQLFGLWAIKRALPEIHLNLTDDPTSLRQALNGNLGRTHHGEMLGAALGSLGTEDAVTVVNEVTVRDFDEIGMRDIAAGHRQLVGAILGMS